MRSSTAIMSAGKTPERTARRAGWQFWVDRGGTFTDIIARRPDGSLASCKLLSEQSAERGARGHAVLDGIRQLMALAPDAPIPAELIECVRVGTTVATNALLERKGEPSLLVVTRGFRDALRIGYQNRPRLFDLQIRLPQMLYAQVEEVDERIAADGRCLRPLDVAGLRAALRAGLDAGLRSVAIVFMHAYREPVHEVQAAALARALGYRQVSASHEASAMIRFVPRGDTAVADAYLSPVVRDYVEGLQRALPGVRLLFMQSSGGLAGGSVFRGKDAILSGPAGGIVGAARTALQEGCEQVIAFDMGGTSTDVSHYGGEFEREFETQVAGVRLRAPMLRIHTIAAGGGSILRFEDGRYQVGPASAGAVPGPACYRLGGPLTLTDANLLLGRIQPAFFPMLFGAGGDAALDAVVVRDKFAALAASIGAATQSRPEPETVAAGFIEVAAASMANAIRRVSVERGHDVTRHVLACFGGAGGQHACRVADLLEMGRILIHPFAGLLSAYGIGLADAVAIRERSVELPLDEASLPALDAAFREIAAPALAELGAAEVDGCRLTEHVHVRYAGTDTSLPVPRGDIAAMRAAYDAQYRRTYGFLMPDRALVADAISVEAAGGAAAPETPPVAGPVMRDPAPVGRVRMWHAGHWSEVACYERTRLQAGERIDGPALVVEAHSTTVVDPGWRAEVRPSGSLLMERVEVLARGVQQPGIEVLRPDPVRLELFNGLFMAVAEEMGIRLQQTASSVNIKERLDFSCAVFDAAGNLVANAPHLPVHLGSMGEAVKAVIRGNAAPGASRIAPGSAFMLNMPYEGGTHLPDVTVVTPVFDRDGGAPRFWVASRGHHAEIGGIAPGSMPPGSRVIEEEGVLIRNFLLVEQGRLREAEALALFSSGPYPSRNPQQNLADLRAMIAANETGVQALHAAVARHGQATVDAYMQHIQDNAEEAVRCAIAGLSDGRFEYPMDNGAVIRVAVTIDRATRGARVDFGGTSAQLPDNFNAPFAVTLAAVLYVFRTLAKGDIPLNAGCLKPVALHIPPGSMLNPSYPAAVVAGNVETSQAVTDALYGALGIMAAAQGTMNNLSFGNARHQYYETLCGGSGAGPGFDGVDAVHTHMTNTRLTDPEVLELRYPVRLEAFEIRHGSGGAGRWHGGAGVRRRIRFLEPMQVSIVSNRRKVPPYGMDGGRAGSPGINRWIRHDGGIERLDACATLSLEADDQVEIETPGGGGYGKSSDEEG